MISKEQFIKLAAAFITQQAYEREILKTIRKTATKYHQEMESIGLPLGTDLLTSAVEDILGEDFLYWYYDCAGDFNAFNEKTTHEDGSHPHVTTVEELYDYSKKEGAVGKKVSKDVSLCENCWCMSHTLEGGICEKCKKSKVETKND